jgi:uncharacterized ubiquitin-like protein YukD
MPKILVNVAVPSLGESYDVRIPTFLKIRTLIPMVVEAVVELSAKQYVPSGSECLCSREHNKVLTPGHTVSECGIQNGDHLFLF